MNNWEQSDIDSAIANNPELAKAQQRKGDKGLGKGTIPSKIYHGTGVALRDLKEWEAICPVCEGDGRTSKHFGAAFNNRCRACNGTGIVDKSTLPGLLPAKPANATVARHQASIKVSEEDFAATFDDYATLRGWTWCGFRPARQKIGGEETYRTPIIGQKGLPDRILARNGVVLLVELKAEDGKLSPWQKIWGIALKGFKGYHVVRPSDWEEIERLIA